MTHNPQRYEVYIEEMLGQPRVNPMAAQWIWHRIDAAGLVTVHGSHHASLEACFASARKHREAFGDAPITINLRKGMAGDVPKLIILAADDRDITIISEPLH